MKQSLLLIIAGLFFAFAGTASAENGHSYSGSYCNPYYGNQQSDFRHQHDGINNTSSGSRWVSCPVAEDELNNTKGTTRLWFRWNAKKSTDKITCYFRSFGVNNEVLQTTSKVDSGGGWFLIPNITKDNFWGNYNMWCSLPSGATLQKLWIGEKS